MLTRMFISASYMDISGDIRKIMDIVKETSCEIVLKDDPVLVYAKTK